MIKTNRKKLLLEKHNRLTPIDDAQLKSKQKLPEVDSETLQNDSQSNLPLSMKSKKPFEIPAIDHQKQRDKLKFILEKTKQSQFPTTTAKSSMFPQGLQTVTSHTNSKSNFLSQEEQKGNDRKRKKIMSHQNSKASQSEERQQEQQNNTDSNQIEKQVKAIARGSKSSIRQIKQKLSKREAQYNTTNEEKKVQRVKPSQAPVEKKPQTAGSTSGAGSKWMKELARQNFIYLAEKLQDHQAKQKINMLTQIRGEIKKRLMKVYRMFRHKKYGEPLEPVVKVQEDQAANKEQEELKAQKALIQEEKLKKKLDEQLNTVIEEESLAESEFGDLVNFKNPTECAEYLRDYIEENLVYEFILIHADNVCKVKSFLQMVLLRRRYIKMKSASLKIQTILRKYSAKKQVSTLRQQKLDEIYKLKLQQHIKNEEDKNKLHIAALKIQSLYHRLKYSKELKEMRLKLKQLPYECRRSYVKMQELKLSTYKLRTDLSHKLKK